MPEQVLQQSVPSPDIGVSAPATDAAMAEPYMACTGGTTAKDNTSKTAHRRRISFRFISGKS